ncbi:uncharacterized protein LAESUDRAFT_715986 [Laetiporus sulphureus 93-53]|uniref:Uncharacterized protein n=1 Tax=Laetiporus sulphureus 93-53 TaxID=1314785 RepID=A0A165CZU7_9APHY|nr:uncharacterized protein LAESUDRAFT_715986 [Laetiporus sulphureus 93-53]KZT03845.1 hypothetical protein LAESUDRAFT_715986 [Laetiporus sulphureus 93-53]
MPHSRPYTKKELNLLKKEALQAIIESNIHLWPAKKKYQPRGRTTKRDMINVIANAANGFRICDDGNASEDSVTDCALEQHSVKHSHSVHNDMISMDRSRLSLGSASICDDFSEDVNQGVLVPDLQSAAQQIPDSLDGDLDKANVPNGTLSPSDAQHVNKADTTERDMANMTEGSIEGNNTPEATSPVRDTDIARAANDFQLIEQIISKRPLSEAFREPTEFLQGMEGYEDEPGFQEYMHPIEQHYRNPTEASVQGTNAAMDEHRSFSPQGSHLNSVLWNQDRVQYNHTLLGNMFMRSEAHMTSSERFPASSHERRHASSTMDMMQTKVDVRIIDHRGSPSLALRSSFTLRCYTVGSSGQTCIKAEELLEAVQNSPCCIEGNARLATALDDDLEPFVKLTGPGKETTRACFREMLYYSSGEILELHILKLSDVPTLPGEYGQGKRKRIGQPSQQKAERVLQETEETKRARSTAQPGRMIFLEEASAVFNYIKNVNAASESSDFTERWQSFVKQKGYKVPSDADMVEAFQFAFDFVKKWVGQTVWIKNDGTARRIRITKKHLYTLLDRDTSWFSPVNRIVAILQEIGPHSKQADPKVVERLADPSSRGGQDQLRRFLEERMDAYLHTQASSSSTLLL